MGLAFLWTPGVFHGFDSLPLGCVVATCELVDCLPVEDVYHYLYKHNRENEELFGDFSAGRFAWLLTDVQALDPVEYVGGHQGLWNWS